MRREVGDLRARRRWQCHSACAAQSHSAAPASRASVDGRSEAGGQPPQAPRGGDAMLGSAVSGGGATLARAAVGVGVGEQEEVAVGLGRVAQGEGAGVAQAERHRAGDQRGEPAEDGDGDEQRPPKALASSSGRKREHEPEADGPAVLRSALGDAEFDRIAAARAGEARGRDWRSGRGTRTRGAGSARRRRGSGAARPGEVPVKSVANQLTIAANRASDAPQREPDQVRDREQQAEEDGEAAAPQLVARPRPGSGPRESGSAPIAVSGSLEG